MSYRDPDAWPADASPTAVMAFRTGLAYAVGLGWLNVDAYGSWWECPKCRGAVPYAPRAYRLLPWWVCRLGCNDTPANRRAARLWRRAFDWRKVERAASDRAAFAGLAAVEQERRRELRDLRSALGEAWWALELDVCCAALVVPVNTTSAAGASWRSYRCAACRREWQPFSPHVEAAEELRGRLPWWRCPRGCNAAAARRVRREARTPAARRLVCRIPERKEA